MQKAAAERYVRSIYADMVRQVANLMGVSPVQASVEFGNQAAVDAWGKPNAFHRRGAAAETANGMTVVSSAELKNADEADLRGMIAHEVSHLYGANEVTADAVRWAINGDAGSLKGSYDKWTPSADSKTYAQNQGWSGGSADTSGGGGGGQTDTTQTNGTNQGGGGGGGTGGGGGKYTTSADYKNPADLIRGFISGEVLRNNISVADWKGMLTFAGKMVPGAQPDGIQPLQLFAEMYAAEHQTKNFEKYLAAGVSAKVWDYSKNGGGYMGYTYQPENVIGQPGNPGQAPPGYGTQPPPKAANATQQTQKNNAANFELWLQQAGISINSNIQAIIDQAAKQGWNKARFELAIEDQTKQGQAFLDQQQAYKESAFTSWTNQWEIGSDKNIEQLVQHAAQNNWSEEQFKEALYDTPEFQKQYPGIFNRDGTLKMTPDQYQINEQAYKDAADAAGIGVGGNRIAWLFRNNVSPNEFRDRSAAIGTLRTNDAYFKAFNQERKAMGLSPLSRGDQFKFVLGEGNQQWYDQWNAAASRYTGEQAGISFGAQGNQGAYTHLSDKMVTKLEQKAINPATGQVDLSVLQTDYGKLADYLSKTLPESQLTSAGLSKKDLAEAAFGGPRSQAIRDRIDQITKNIQAYSDYTPSSQGLNQGLGQNQGGQQQKYGQGP